MESMKVAAWSETHYVDMMPHTPPRSRLHGGHDPFLGGGRQFLLAGNPQ
jgi:hypothetical protein